MLIDVDQLLRAYYEEHPDPVNPAQAVSFGTSGHRGTSLEGTFTEDHIVAISEAIARYRAAQGITGPLFIGRDTHALSAPAFRTAVEVLVANDVRVAVDAEDGYTPTPAISHAILTHNSGSGARDTAGWNRHHPVTPTRPADGASSTTRRTAARPTPTSPARSRTRPTSGCARAWARSNGQTTTRRSPAPTATTSSAYASTSSAG